MHSESDHLTSHSYTITPAPESSGHGWHLRVFVDGEEAGCRLFLSRAADCAESLAWWDALTTEEQVRCASHAISATQAHQRHLLDVAYAEAENTACAWMDARQSSLPT